MWTMFKLWSPPTCCNKPTVNLVIVLRILTSSTHNDNSPECGCGAIGRAVASNTRDPWFESDIDNFSYQQLYNKLFWKDENKIKKRPGIAQFKKKTILSPCNIYLQQNNSNSLGPCFTVEISMEKRHVSWLNKSTFCCHQQTKV